MGAVFGDIFYVLDLWPRILRNFFTKNAFNSIRALFFPREGSRSHEKNGGSTKATHGATSGWGQCLEIFFTSWICGPEFSEIFSQKMHLIPYERYFSHARGRGRTKRMGAAQRQHMAPPPDGGSVWRYFLRLGFVAPNSPKFFHKKCI